MTNNKFIFNSEETEILARNMGCRLFSTSVKEDVNVASVFRYLAKKCHQLIKQQYEVVLPISTPMISKLKAIKFDIDFIE